MSTATTKLSRADFVRAHAAPAVLPSCDVSRGVSTIGGRTMVALPCACGEDGCEGWAMIDPVAVNDHLELFAPEPIRSVMRALVLQERLK